MSKMSEGKSKIVPDGESINGCSISQKGNDEDFAMHEAAIKMEPDNDQDYFDPEVYDRVECKLEEDNNIWTPSLEQQDADESDQVCLNDENPMGDAFDGGESDNEEMWSDEDVDDPDESDWDIVDGNFKDYRIDPLPNYKSEFDGINPNVGFTSDMSVTDCFKKFITIDIMNHILECINENVIDSTGSGNDIKRPSLTKSVDIDDLCVFLALYFYTGVCKYSELNEYWSRKPYQPGVHFFSPDVMSRDRYSYIMRFLCFNNPKNRNKNDFSTQLDNFCSIITDVASMNVYPGKHVAVGEAVELSEGKLLFRQSLKTKSTRSGVRLFIMCNADKKWVSYNRSFALYYGKKKVKSSTSLDTGKLSYYEKIIINLSQSVLGCGRHIAVDNCYATVRLGLYFQSKCTLLTGSIHPNKVPAKELVSKNLDKYDSAFYRKNNCLIVKWEEKRSVYVISTNYTAGLVKKDRTYFGGVQKIHNKPHQIDKLDEYVNSIDKADLLIEPLEPSRKSQLWFKKMGLHLMFRMVLNSYLVYKNIVNNKLTFKYYLLRLVEELIEAHSPLGKSISEKYLANNTFGKHKRKDGKVVHALGKIPNKPGNTTKFPTKRCRVCYPKRKDIRLHCIGCPEKPGLCSIEHFRIWHYERGREVSLDDM